MTPFAASVQAMLLRELRALRREIDAYPDDASVWTQPPGIPNSAGTLALHIAGNLQHFVGAMLGGSGYQRDRPREFAVRNLTRADVVVEINAAMRAVERGLEHMTDAGFEAPFPQPIADRSVATGAWLIHLCSHLAYHLGQIDYHRRVVTGLATGVDAISVKEMPLL